jgi:hypothetical protein
VGNGVGARLLLAIKQPLEIELAQVAHACVANEFSGRAHKPPHSKTNTLITCPCRGSANCKLQLPQGGYLQQSPPPTSTQQLPHGPPSAPPRNDYPTPPPPPPPRPHPPAHPRRPGSTGTPRPPGTVGPRWPPASGWSACSSGGARCGWGRPQSPAGRSSRGHCAVVVLVVVTAKGRVGCECMAGASLVGVSGVTGSGEARVRGGGVRVGV